MGWFEDAVAWVENAAEDVVDFVEDTAEAVGDVVEDVVEAVGDVVEDVVEAVGDVVEDVVDAVGDVVEAVGEAVEDVAEWTLNTLDDYVFDPVDYITGGVIDIDYDDGQFSAGLDIGIASVGVSFGEQGFSADAGFDIGLASGEISYDSSDGLAMSGSLGVEWGPLPYVEGHLSISPDGDVMIGGELQATLPFVDIDAGFNAGFGRNPDGTWGAAADASLDVSTPSVDLSIDADGSISVDADGNISRDGDLDVQVDRDGDGDDDLDDMIGGGVFGGNAGSPTDGMSDGEIDTLTGAGAGRGSRCDERRQCRPRRGPDGRVRTGDRRCRRHDRRHRHAGPRVRFDPAG